MVRRWSIKTALVTLFFSLAGNAYGVSDSVDPASFGMNSVVLPNPHNTIVQELIEREKELVVREALLQERERDFMNRSANTRRNEMLVLVSGLFFLGLIMFNLRSSK